MTIHTWFLTTTAAWLLIAIPHLAGAETSVAGTWQAQSTPPGATWTAVLRVDGSKLTGAVSPCASWAPGEIYETLIEGDTVTFKCKTGGRSILTFIGTVSGDHLDLTWDLQVPPYGNGLVGDIREDDPVEAKTVRRLFGPSAPRRLAAVRGPDAEGDLAKIAAKAQWTPAKPAPVPFERILHAEREPQNWLTYSGTLFGQRHSPLTQITPENVQKLELAWVWQARSKEKFEATPLVVDGVLYTVEAPSTVVAMDASTGQVLWTYAHTPPLNILVCCGGVNRGLAILDHTLFLGTLDAHLLAIDARTGRLLWDTVVANAFDPACRAICYSITLAPLIVKDKVIVGTAGGDPPPGFGIRAFVAAFDANTGKEVWRFSTIPAPGEPGHDTWSGDSWKTGGAAIWNTGTYDPDLNLTYWGTGNPSPDFDGATRLGDNLYSSSVVALDADTGKLKWHYQFTPHDEMDWDAAQVPLLTGMEWQGEERKVMLFANRNGLMYTLDRRTGQLLTAKPFVEVNWMSGFDDQGRPIRVPRKEGTPVLPSSANNWYPPSYSPHTGLFYVPAAVRPGSASQDGLVVALNPMTGEKKWEFTLPELPKRPIGSPCPCSTGVLTTASDLLFTGGQGRYFYALDARTGQLLWKTSTGGPVQTGAISYSVNGRQYIAVPAGNTLFAFSLPQQ